VIVKVGAGTVLDVIARQGNWFEVSLPLSENGLRRTGFISGTVVQLIQGPKAGSSGGVSASTEGDAVKKRIPGVEFIGKWNGYYRPDRFARFEATPSRQLVITRENGIFTIASRDLKNGGSAYSWHAVYVNDKLVCAGPDGKPEPPDPVTGLGPEVNRLPNGDLQLIQEGETRMRRVQ
jgi:hypothetical protein